MSKKAKMKQDKYLAAIQTVMRDNWTDEGDFLVSIRNRLVYEVGSYDYQYRTDFSYSAKKERLHIQRLESLIKLYAEAQRFYFTPKDADRGTVFIEPSDNIRDTKNGK